jgi:hypothetical protein
MAERPHLANIIALQDDFYSFVVEIMPHDLIVSGPLHLKKRKERRKDERKEGRTDWHQGRKEKGDTQEVTMTKRRRRRWGGGEKEQRKQEYDGRMDGRTEGRAKGIKGQKKGTEEREVGTYTLRGVAW